VKRGGDRFGHVGVAAVERHVQGTRIESCTPGRRGCEGRDGRGLGILRVDALAMALGQLVWMKGRGMLTMVLSGSVKIGFRNEVVRCEEQGVLQCVAREL
jgi:hypothetical protein